MEFIIDEGNDMTMPDMAVEMDNFICDSCEDIGF
jgi:hypothetical protein